MNNTEELLKGRGAQYNPANKFRKNEYVTEHIEGLDEPAMLSAPKTEYFSENPKKVVNKVDSPD
ncbi:MAG: radical SAM protein, partial [Hymenobacteraceae bacterium]|nr:radical SAM protein [Hymenobacteraceae bacterium]MDX5397071.1 radical SAM protein [Hymenobacteraceae bacterium]MDX5513141.1 radical SAM protein [Hymenobacteraceae bacterium]